MTRCDRCGSTSSDGARFCGQCAAPLAPAGPEVRKTVTIVFCDLVGSTALGESVDPEVLRTIMGGYHARLREVLEQHGGTVEKFVGDAAMAIFGIPKIHEDDAVRAVRAAVLMRDAAHDLGLEVRIGVNTGEVVVGTGETLATGDAVNVAARLEQSAGAGTILVGAQTEELVRDHVALEPVEPLVVKGKAEPVPAYAVAELPTAAGPVPPPLSALVGREDEMAVLEEALRQARDKRVPQLVTVVGAPGVGKSRLVAELVARVPGEVLVGRCLSYGDAITYWPLVEILDALGDVGSVLGGADDAGLVVARLGAARGLPGAAASPEEVAWAFRRLLEQRSRDRLLVVVLDDIHWAEPTLLDLVDYVATFTQDAPLVLLCTARPELFEVRPSWATPRPHATIVQLDPLAPGQAAALVRELGPISEEVLLRIVEASDGNPLFVEQLVAVHRDSPSTELEVPPSLQALLGARIDRLETEERLVIERASVEGRIFHRGAVTELLPERSRPDASMRLVGLVRRELIRPDRATIRGDDGFRFGHLLIRDAAYESMPKRVRAELHQRYADWLGDRLGDDAPREIVGHHLEQAHGYLVELGEEPYELGARVAEVLGEAGRAALGRRDVAAAGKLLTRALAVAREPVRRHLLLDQVSALRDSGEPDRETAAIVEVLALAEAAGDERCRWLAELLDVQRTLSTDREGVLDDAAATAERVLAASAEDDHPVRGRAWAVLAETHAWRGHYEPERAALDHALDHARQAGDRALEIDLSSSYAGTLVYGSVPVQEGRRRLAELVAHTEGAVHVQLMARHVLAHFDAREGRFDGAREAVAALRTHVRELGQERHYALMAGCVWDVSSLSGHVEEAELALQEGYDILERMGETAIRSTLAAFLGEAAYRQGRLDDAERYAAASEGAGSPDDHLNGALWRAVRAKVLSARGDQDAATALVGDAVVWANRTDLIEAQADIHMDQATVLLGAGDHHGARAAAELARRLYEAKGNLVSSARAAAFIEDLPTSS